MELALSKKSWTCLTPPLTANFGLAAESWTEDESRAFLEENHLYRIMDVFFPSKSTKDCLEMKMFEKCETKKNTLNLTKAPIDQLFKLLTLPSSGMKLSLPSPFLPFLTSGSPDSTLMNRVMFFTAPFPKLQVD